MFFHKISHIFSPFSMRIGVIRAVKALVPVYWWKKRGRERIRKKKGRVRKRRGKGEGGKGGGGKGKRKGGRTRRGHRREPYRRRSRGCGQGAFRRGFALLLFYFILFFFFFFFLKGKVHNQKERKKK